MAEFQNTIDLIGDEETARRIVSKTIEEYHDNLVTFFCLYSLSKCSSLRSVNAPNAKRVSNYAFLDCPSLNSANLPKVTKLDGNVFENCSNLTDVNIQSVEDIGANAFSNCSALTFLDISSVVAIQANAFWGTNLSILILRSTNTSNTCRLTNTTAFTNCPFADGMAGGTLLVPRALVETYQNATNWSVILAYTNNRILALEDYTVDGTTTGEIDWDKLGGTA